MEDQPSIPWNTIVPRIRRMVSAEVLPSVSMIAGRERDPFHVLVSTIISLRTKDKVTAEASSRLLSQASDPAKMSLLSPEEIADLIYPAGFYRVKGENIRKAAEIIIRDHDGHVPPDLTELLKFPGVGRKTANLVLSLGFGIDAICVDIHVHRISNRMGWVYTKEPDETERELMKILPRKYWIGINGLLVAFGQKICTPVSPHCSECDVYSYCRRVGVERSR